MSEKELVERISELLLVLKGIVSDLDEVRAALESGITTVQPPPKQTAVPETSPFTGEAMSKPESKSAVTATLEDIEKAFPQDLAGLLYFEVTERYFLVKPRQYLGSDNFRTIAAIVRNQLGGEYVSAGKDSHFKIPRDQPSPGPPKTIGL